MEDGLVVPIPTLPAVNEILPVDDAQKRLFEIYFKFAIRLPVELAEMPEESKVPAIVS